MTWIFLPHLLPLCSTPSPRARAVMARRAVCAPETHRQSASGGRRLRRLDLVWVTPSPPRVRRAWDTPTSSIRCRPGGDMDAWRAATGPDPDQVTLRRQVLRVLAQHPAGLTPGEIASQLGLTTSLARVLRAMV